MKISLSTNLEHNLSELNKILIRWRTLAMFLYYIVRVPLQMAFECISVLAVITNTALVALSPAVQLNMSCMGEISTVLLFVLAEVRTNNSINIDTLNCQSRELGLQSSRCRFEAWAILLCNLRQSRSSWEICPR